MSKCLCYEYPNGHKTTGYCPIHKTFCDVINEIILTTDNENIGFDDMPCLAMKLNEAYEKFHHIPPDPPLDNPPHHSGHGRTICAKCNTVMFQCRCIHNHENVHYGICESCKMLSIT